MDWVERLGDEQSVSRMGLKESFHLSEGWHPICSVPRNAFYRPGRRPDVFEFAPPALLRETTLLSRNTTERCHEEISGSIPFCFYPGDVMANMLCI